MKSLKIIIFTFLCIISSSLYAQSVNETIEKQFTEYIKLSFEDFEKSLDYTPEEVFETISKEEMILIYEYGYNQIKGEYIIFPPEIKSFGKITQIEGVNYVKFQYLSKIQIGLRETENTEIEILYLKRSYEEMYGIRSVTFNEEIHSFEINQTGNVIAISDNLKNWKFVSIENESERPDMLHFIPKQLFE